MISRTVSLFIVLSFIGTTYAINGAENAWVMGFEQECAKGAERRRRGIIKRSGLGRELGPHGIREFVNAQQVWVGPAQT